MSERVIAKRTLPPAGHGWESQYCQLREDLEAPSIAEVVEVLKEARGEYDAMLGHASRPTEGEIPDRIDRIDNLIARLEGA